MTEDASERRLWFYRDEPTENGEQDDTPPVSQAAEKADDTTKIEKISEALNAFNAAVAAKNTAQHPMLEAPVSPPAGSIEEVTPQEPETGLNQPTNSDNTVETQDQLAQEGKQEQIEPTVIQPNPEPVLSQPDDVVTQIPTGQVGAEKIPSAREQFAGDYEKPSIGPAEKPILKSAELDEATEEAAKLRYSIDADLVRPATEEEGVREIAPVGRKKQLAKSRKESDDKRHSLLEAYFGQRPAWIYFCVLAGLAAIFHPGRYDPIYGFELSLDALMIAGITCIIFGVFWRIFVMKFPSDHQVDNWTTDALRNLETNALDQMSLSETDLVIDPIVFAGFPDFDRAHGTYRSSRYGKDHILRYTPRALTVLAFRQHDVIAYEGAVDLTTGNSVYENVSSFFYRDITSVGIAKQVVEKDLRSVSDVARALKPWSGAFADRIGLIISGKKAANIAAQRWSRDVFVITLANGDRVQSILRDGRLSCDREHDEMPIAMEKNIIRAIGDLVRQKKAEQLSGIGQSAQIPRAAEKVEALPIAEAI